MYFEPHPPVDPGAEEAAPAQQRLRAAPAGVAERPDLQEEG